MTNKICLKLAWVSVTVKTIKKLKTLYFTRHDSDVTIESFQEIVRELEQILYLGVIAKGFRLEGN